jgi:DNA-binding transcriptional LysR family regulator
MLNPIWLKTFVTLIDIGHFTKTAEKLFMTQPGVSQHINKLEKSCGYTLIIRDKKSFEITEQGRLVYQYAIALVENEHALLDRLTFDNPFSGSCTLACSGALALMLYPSLLDLQVLHSSLVIKLKAAPNYQILNEIQTGIIDLGIITDVANKSLFDITEIGSEQLCLVLPANINIDESLGNLLTQLGLIDHPDAEHYLSLYFSKSQELNLTHLNIEEIPISGYVNQISQILEPVAKGLGFTVLPKSAVDTFQTPEKLQILSLKQPVMQTLYMVKKRNRALPARFKVIKSALKKHLVAVNNVKG